MRSARGSVKPKAGHRPANRPVTAGRPATQKGGPRRYGAATRTALHRHRDAFATATNWLSAGAAGISRSATRVGWSTIASWTTRLELKRTTKLAGRPASVAE